MAAKLFFAEALAVLFEAAALPAVACLELLLVQSPNQLLIYVRQLAGPLHGLWIKALAHVITRRVQ